MAFLTTTIEGVEYGAEKHRGTAAGMFTRRADGTWQQDRGTGQTPVFRDEKAFRRWVLAERRRAAEAEGRRPGRPVSTGSDSTRPVQYRVSAAQRAELEAEARCLGLASADAAAKRRAFPNQGVTS